MSENNSICGQTVNDYIKDTFEKLRKVMVSSKELEGLNMYSDYSGVNRMSQEVISSINQLVQDIFEHQDISANFKGEDLETQMEFIRDTNDCLLERIHSDIDEALGLKRNDSLDTNEATVTRLTRPSGQSSNSMVLLASKNVQKPQLFFSEKVDNSKKRPFMPLIKDKPNNKKPLAIMLCMDEEGREFYSHPYEFEISHFVPDANYIKTALTPQIPEEIDDSPFLLVDSEETLVQAIEEMRSESHIAVDVEHHGFRTYLGLTSLIQISTRGKDYIIDPLKLRGKLAVLNEIFTHPKIVKVLHGADMDVLWLQRDCGLYLVNMFDTHLAAVSLEFAERSLAALLNTFCKVHADKRYQRADWRIRPLPADFILYARMDTHYLLYIHDLMHNLLLEKDAEGSLVNTVYSSSAVLCLKRYEKPQIHSKSYFNLYRKSRKMFDTRQEFALRELFLWRDKTAREHDESTDYVLPRHMLLQISEVLPRDMPGVLACCNPIPPLVKTELMTIHSIVKTAREQPLHKRVISMPEIREHSSALNSRFCLHDLSQTGEGEELQCLLDDKTSDETMFGDLFEQHSIKLKKHSSLMPTWVSSAKKNVKSKSKGMIYLSPFERYIRYKEHKEKLPQFETVVVKEELEEEETDSRISRIRDHFLSLEGVGAKELVYNADSPASTDEDRVSRLLAGVRSSLNTTTESDENVVVRHTITYSEDGTKNIVKNGDDRDDSSDSSDDSSDSSDEDSKNDDVKSDKVVNDVKEEGEASSTSSDDSSSSDEEGNTSLKRKHDDSSDDEFEIEKINRLRDEASKKMKAAVEPFNYSKTNYGMFQQRKKGGRGRGNSKNRRSRGRGGKGRGNKR